MEAVNFLTDWIGYLLIVIPLGAGSMVTYFALRKSVASDMDEIFDYDIKIRQTIRGAIVGISLSGLITIIKSFYM